jgi:Flp pilus assembly protein TadD
MSALLTTRGGAFRDLGDLDKAKNCAFSAIKLRDKSQHPFNLLGAIFYQEGNPGDGNKYFNEAEKRGASRGTIDRQIRDAYDKATDAAKEQIDKYLESRRKQHVSPNP